MKKLVSESNLNLIVESAGLNATSRHPAPYATKIMRLMGTDISNYISRQLTLKSLVESDLVLTMEAKQKDAIIFYYPQIKQKVSTLKEFSGESNCADIMDPYGKSYADFELCAETIKISIFKAFNKFDIFSNLSK